MKFHSLSFALGLLFGGLGIFLFGNDSGDGKREDKKRVEEQAQRSGGSRGGEGSERYGVPSRGRNPVSGSEGDLLAFLEEGRKREGSDAQNYLTRLRFFHEIASMGETEVEEFLLSYTRVKDESLLALLPELGEKFRTNYAQDRFLKAASEKEKSVEGLLELADLSEEEHVQARRTIISNLAYRDPRAAGKWTEAQEEGEQRDRLMKSVASQWIEKEPEVGADWCEANLNDSTRPDGLVHVFENWSRKDSTKAAEWLLKQTDDSSRDLAEAAGLETGP